MQMITESIRKGYSTSVHRSDV